MKAYQSSLIHLWYPRNPRSKKRLGERGTAEKFLPTKRSVLWKNMAEATADEKPRGAGGTGNQKPEPENSEVSGRARRRALYTCFRDGAQNYVDPSWNWFMCWQCSGLTYLN